MARRLTRGARRWYEGLSPATAEIECGGQRHRITWRLGELVVEDHDVLAERALAALGSDLPLCVEVLDAWCAMRDTEWVHEFLLTGSTLCPAELALRRASRDLYVEGVQESPPSPPGTSTNSARAPWRQQLEREAARRLERQSQTWAITLLEALSPAVRSALALSMIVKVERRWQDDYQGRQLARDVESALTAIAVSLFEQSARRRNRKSSVRFIAEMSLVTPGERSKSAAWAGIGGAYAALSLPLSWFTDVWARGLGLVDDCLVLSLTDRPADDRELAVVALRWERRALGRSKCVEAPARATRERNGDWRLRWT